MKRKICSNCRAAPSCHAVTCNLWRLKLITYSIFHFLMENTLSDSDPIRQFATKVVSFSSQYGGEHSQTYAASNLAGSSYKFPSYGDFTQAFVLVCGLI